MKKFLIASVLTSLICACPLVGGCAKSTTTVTGEMHYNDYGTEYGVRVNVQVKDGVIKRVEIAKSDYVIASTADSGWDSSEWDKGLAALLASYNGKSVEEILGKEVAKNGEKPLVKGDEGFKNYGDEFIISGATLGSGRLLLAVQDALSKL